ncbi:zinc finger MYM-type protein 1-like [Mytilus trossulus]|uniref:zinc finger MYM-type protein 1-like n=1 Tax=Mytilus trossulus TaxID=6551 RepID=UPI003006D221
MAGRKSGVQQRIKEIEPKALYNHCHGHLLNLACADKIKKNESLSSAMDTAYEITKLVKKSPNRDTHLEKICKDAATDLDRPNSKIRNLCPTRWTVKADALLSIIDNYDTLNDLWDWSLQTVKDTDMKARIRGVQAHMQKFEFFFGSSLAEVLLRNADNLSKTLQYKDLSAAESKSIARKTVQTLKSLRDDKCFNLFWENVIMKSRRKSVEEPVLPRKRRMPSRFETGTATAEFHSTPKDFYRQKYYQAVDHIVQAITNRFEQEDFTIYLNTEQVLLKCTKGVDFSEEFKIVCQFYKEDLHEANLQCQLRLFATIFESATPREDIVLADIITFIR